MKSFERFSKLYEAVNKNDFNRVKTAAPKVDSKSSDESLSDAVMFKLIATLSNLHSTVSDFYKLKGDDAKSKLHQELSLRFRNESNKVR